MQAFFSLKLTEAEESPLIFWKNYEQLSIMNSDDTLQHTSYNICCTSIGPKALQCWYFPPRQHREE